jgi:hypothetical protein
MIGITEISISLSEILVAVLAIVSAGLGYIIKEQREQLKSIKQQLSDKKYKVYHEVFSFFFDFFKAQKKLIDAPDSDFVSKLIDIKKDLMIYAPDILVKKFFEWNNLLSSKSVNPKHLKVFLELCILIRKDMGHEKTTVGVPDILRSIMDGDEEFELIKDVLI